ncbi:MAG TPA: zinc-binding alcohol dehydrogenase family protein [Actinomycetes bacterium]|nr:zinc-binding alcohol dehydrogenase family protein [Actinomycetes bacterium]
MSIRAARLAAHGQPLLVQDVELPTPSADEVLVELAYGGVNPFDGYVAAGRVAPDAPLPRTLGGEASGLLDGRPVVIAGEGLGTTRDGVFAEAAVVPRDAVVEVPAGVSLRDAAAMGIVGLTAYRVVQTAHIGPDDRVLVLGGSGAVGLSAISYAASTGARVWGQTRSAAKATAIRDMGAKDAVVADAPGLAAAVRDINPTVVLDPLGGAFTSAVLTVMAARGRLVLFGASAGSEATLDLLPLYRNQIQLLTYAGVQATRDERRAGISAALTAAAEGRLRVGIGREVPLEAANDALTALADASIAGKVLLRLR